MSVEKETAESEWFGRFIQGKSLEPMSDEVKSELTLDRFLRLREAGIVDAGISHSAAIRLIHHLPKRFQFAHHFWTWVWILSIPGSIAVGILFRWWVGLALLVFLTPALFRGIKTSAAEFVLEYALEDSEFFAHLVANDFLTLRSYPEVAADLHP